MTKQELGEAVCKCLSIDDNYYAGISYEKHTDEEMDKEASLNNELGFCLTAVFEIDKMCKAQGGELNSRQAIAIAVFDAKCKYIFATEVTNKYG